MLIHHGHYLGVLPGSGDLFRCTKYRWMVRPPQHCTQVVNVTGLGLLLPTEIVQSALDAFTTHLTKGYPLDIHADSVQITDDGVTAHYSTRDTSIREGNQGNQGNNEDPCFAGL